MNPRRREAAIASTAGVILLIAEPAAGSTLKGGLGITAAVSGLSVGALAVIGVIYAQAKNLWRFVPGSIRAVVWALVVIGLIVTIVNHFTQLLSL